MPRVLLVLTIAVWMATAGSAAAAPPPPPPPGHIAFAAGPNSPVTVGTRPKGIAVGDLDNDGDLDFVTANTGSDTYTPVYGNGSCASRPAFPRTPATVRSRSSSPTLTATPGWTSPWRTATPTRCG